MMKCYYCQKVVERLDHQEHVRLLEALLGADLIGIDNAFVHMRSPGVSPTSGHRKPMPPDEAFDEDGTAVVCDRCFIRELDEALSTY